MQWKNLSNEAKSVLEWLQNPFTDKYEDVQIKIGTVFHRDCPGNRWGDGNVDIPITQGLFSEIVKYIKSDNTISYKVLSDGSLICKLKKEACE